LTSLEVAFIWYSSSSGDRVELFERSSPARPETNGVEAEVLLYSVVKDQFSNDAGFEPPSFGTVKEKLRILLIVEI